MTASKIPAQFPGVRVFLFDFDGVLADSLGDIASSVNAALRHFDCPELEQETVRGFVGDGARCLLSRAFAAAAGKAGLPSALSDAELDERLAWYKRWYETHAVEKTVLYPGAAALLAKIRAAGAASAVVSNKPARVSAVIAEKLGIAADLCAIIGPEDTGKTKPAPDGLAEALRRINGARKDGGRPYTPADVLMTGDSPQDIQAGKNFGCRTCAVLGGYTPAGRLLAAGADFSVRTAGELIQIVP